MLVGHPRAIPGIGSPGWPPGIRCSGLQRCTARRPSWARWHQGSALTSRIGACRPSSGLTP